MTERSLQVTYRKGPPVRRVPPTCPTPRARRARVRWPPDGLFVIACNGVGDSVGTDLLVFEWRFGGVCSSCLGPRWQALQPSRWGSVRVDAHVRIALNVNWTDPMPIRLPSTSRVGESRRRSATNVPFLLPRSSTVASSPAI